jgi:transcriptional regulator with XRE-family HTH domain
MWSFNRERLVALREMKGINQDVFARSLGTSKQHVSTWETGRRVLSIKSLVKICNLYGIDIKYFFAKTDNNNSNQAFLKPSSSPEAINDRTDQS